MTIVLPSLVTLLGIVLGGAVVAFIWGTVCLATMDTGPDWPMALFWPIVIAATIGGWILLTHLV